MNPDGQDCLHGGVVDGDEVGDQVQVARHEDDHEEDLRLARDAGAGSGLPDLRESVSHYRYHFFDTSRISGSVLTELLDPESSFEYGSGSGCTKKTSI